MSLASGVRLGGYEIVALIGAGGMGEVYRAVDTRLKRDVAVKILPPAFADDPDRLARFQREAEVIASLNHPNIAQIYGLEDVAPTSGQANGTRALVLELVEGHTLAERIARGAFPLDEVLPIAKQIAEALEAAHEHGIIHRDLKPANIKITPDGTVKVLDFGLAKLADLPASGSGEKASELSQSPTITSPALVTGGGVLLGTAAYMSPEQAKGRPVDKRTDIWAFGCVLYEMLAGARAFPGEDVTETLAAIIKNEPDWTKLPADMPPAIRKLLRRCLAKDRRQRLADASTARLEIEEALTAPETLSAIGDRPPRGWLVPLSLLLVGIVAGAIAVWGVRPSAAPPRVSRLTIALSSGQKLVGLPGVPSLALSRDGAALAYAASAPVEGGGTTQRVYLRHLEGFGAQPVGGTEGAMSPFFSPDGKWLGFFADGKLKKVPLTGGSPVIIADAPGVPTQAAWGTDGSIVFGSRFAPASALRRVPENGGAVQDVTRLAGVVAHHGPELLPGGRFVLFATGPPTAILAQPISGGEPHAVVPGPAVAPRYAASGQFLFVQDGTLMAAPFDAGRAVTTGPAAQVVQQVMYSVANPAGAQYALSDTGTLAYVRGTDVATERRLVWVTRDGSEQPLHAPPNSYVHPRLSPDSHRVAANQKDSAIWIYNIVTEDFNQLGTGGTVSNDPTWSPDGTSMIFLSVSKASQQTLALWSSDGRTTTLATPGDNQRVGSWSRDGRVVVFQGFSPDTGWDLYTLRLPDRTVEPLLRSPYNDYAAQISPDGRWLAYVSNESARPEVYVRSFPGAGDRRQVSTNSGIEPMWSRDGRELFYRQGDTMMAVEVRQQSGLFLGAPRPLFTGSYIFGNNLQNYDVAPDGRFLMVKPKEAPSDSTEIQVVLNWFEELKGLVPAR